MRWDIADNLYNAISPKMGFTYDATSQVKLKSNISKSFRAPSFNQLYSHLVTADRSTFGNASLRPETSWDGDLGFTYQTPTLKWDQAFFTSQVKDLIAWIETSPTVSTYNNISKDELWGLETSFETKIPGTSSLFGEMNYTYLDIQRSYRPKHSLSRKIKWMTDLFQAYLDYQYISHVNTTSSTKPRLSKNQLVHIGTSLKLSSNLSLSAKVENLFDRSYERFAYYPMPGRTFSLNLTGSL